MIYLLVGVAILAVLLWPRRSILKGDGWRVGAGVTAVVAFAGAAYAGMRSAWEVSAVLVVLGLWSATEARRRPTIKRVTMPAPKSEISLSEARAILGVGPEASLAEVKAAYTRLIQMAHPDKGGTEGLAAQLNAARDRLIRKRS